MVDALSQIERVIDAEGIDCDFERAGHLEAAVNRAQLARLPSQVASMRELGFSAEEFHLLNASELIRRVRINAALGGAFMAHCAALDPARLVRGLARAAEQLGVSIYENSRATGIEGGKIKTTAGEIIAERILVATEGYSGSLPQMRRKLIPIHSMMVATRPLSATERQQVGLEKRSTFNNARHLVTYGQMTADGRIAFGCRGNYFFNSRVLTDFNASDMAFRIARRELLTFFPFLKDIEFTHAWGGALGVSRQLEPMVCFDRKAGVGWAGGYFGDGVVASALAGRTLADLVLARDTERTHTPWVNPEGLRRLDKGLWEPEPLRWAGIKMRSNWMRWTDSAEYRDSALAPLMNWALEHVFP
jgi:glycine/D-amino acid oxidase-like deaminating enzyme